MKRNIKYRNTETFRYYNANPKGRITGDCVTRAIATATGKDYNEVVLDLANIQIETGYNGSNKEGFSILLERYGWTKCKQPRKANGKKYTGEEFCKYLNKMTHGSDCSGIVANLGGNHTVAIMPTDKDDTKENWKVFDIWNSTGGSIGNYWCKKGEDIQ